MASEWNIITGLVVYTYHKGSLSELKHGYIKQKLTCIVMMIRPLYLVIMPMAVMNP